jgi:hypothetical protein
VSARRGSWGRLPPYRAGALPRFPGWAAALGPGIVWLALAQGSGELIWWPYLIAKYGLAFLCLLIPACLLQFPINYAIGSYTLLTGETIFQGFIRISRGAALILWILMTLSFLWFGAFASAGGTALAALTQWPPGWGERGQSLFWGYASIGICFAALVLSRVVYTVVERVMKAVAVLTLIGLVVSCAHPSVLGQLPAFAAGLVIPTALARPWDPADAPKLLTALTFAGLGGFWTLFYSYWLREKGAGMAKTMGHVEGLIGRHQVAFDTGIIPAHPAPGEVARWRRFLAADSAIGIVGNIVTTLMTCLLAYAVLFPQGLVPSEWQLAVVQSRFFEVSWGPAGRMLFLVVAAAFLADTWMATADAVARIHTDCLMAFVPAARRVPVRRWYLIFLVGLTVVTVATMGAATPGTLIVLSAMIGFLGTVSYAFLLYVLNHRWLPRHVGAGMGPQRAALAGLVVSGAAYVVLAVAYVLLQLSGFR